MLAVAGIGAAVAANPIREGNMISGHVLVKGSEENIPYATVLIVGSGQGTVSNEEGQFEFKNLPAGKYTLRVSAVGYKTQEKAIEVNKDFTAVVHFQMEEYQRSGRSVLANPDKQPSRHQCAERGIWAGADTGEHDREGRGGTRWRFGAVRRQCCGRNYQYHHQRPHQQLLPGVEHVLQHGRQVLGAVHGRERIPGVAMCRWLPKITLTALPFMRVTATVPIRPRR